MYICIYLYEKQKMPTEKQPYTIDTQRHLYMAQTRPEYLGSLPRTNFRELPENERRSHLRTAFSKGALAAAERAEAEQGETSLNAALFKVSASIHGFERGIKNLGEIRTAYKGIRTRNMDPETFAEFDNAKNDVQQFNEVITNVIEVGGNRMSFDQLMNFLMTTYRATHGESPSAFESHARDVIVGMRDEVNFKLALMAAGMEVGDTTRKDDRKGKDMEVEGVPIDTKAGRHQAEEAKARARREGHNPDLIVYSGIKYGDYTGGLILPFHKLQEIGERARPAIQRAVDSVHPGRKIA
jgi:hypothetical protein